MKKYLYCVIQTEEPQEFGALGIGGTGDLLVTVHWQDLACVVSDSPLSDYPVMRDHTMAHHRAIEAVRKRFPALLPVCFNTIARGGERQIVEKVLRPRYEEFVDLLDWVADKEEVGVKAYWLKMEPVFENLLKKHPEIRDLKGKLSRLSPAARYYDQIELGKKVEAALKAHRKEEEKRIVDVLNGHALDVKLDPVYGDKWILNAAFFLEKVKVPAFIEALEALGKESDGNLKFTYTTEGAPFHFVEVHVTWEEESHVSH